MNDNIISSMMNKNHFEYCPQKLSQVFLVACYATLQPALLVSLLVSLSVDLIYFLHLHAIFALLLLLNFLNFF